MPEGKSYNKSNGKEAMYADNMRKKATEPKGRHKQPKGSTDMKAKKKMAKPMKNMKSGKMDYKGSDYEF